MLALEQVLVINDPKGTKECRNKRLFSGKRSNNSQDNVSGVKTPSFVSMVKISLKLNQQTTWNLRGDNADLIWPSWLQSTIKLGLHSLPKPLREYACTRGLKFPQFWDLPVGPMVKTPCFPVQGPLVPSRIGKLGSHLPHQDRRSRRLPLGPGATQ